MAVVMVARLAAAKAALSVEMMVQRSAEELDQMKVECSAASLEQQKAEQLVVSKVVLKADS